MFASTVHIFFSWVALCLEILTRVDALSEIEVMSHFYLEEDCELLDVFKENIDGILKKIDALYMKDNLVIATKIAAERHVTLSALGVLERSKR